VSGGRGGRFGDGDEYDYDYDYDYDYERDYEHEHEHEREREYERGDECGQGWGGAGVATWFALVGEVGENVMVV
jgi:hypothetical protein